MHGRGSDPSRAAGETTDAKKDRSRKPPTLPVSPDRIPYELKALKQWIRWRWEWQAGRDAWTKVPISASRDRRASTTSPGTWESFADSVAGVGADGTDGVGFVFAEGDPYCGIDLDRCRERETGALTDEATRILETLSSYSETSPTGTGIHVIVRAKLSGPGRKRDWIEVYDRGRYFAFTGAAATDAAIADRQGEIDELVASLVAAQPGPSSGSAVSADDELISRASRAKNGEAFAKLFSGDWSAYPSQSEADLALAGSLAFWTRREAVRIDRLFRRSGLHRAKWDERHHGDGTTYGEATIARAISTTAEVYAAGARQLPNEWERELLWRTDSKGSPRYLERVVANALLILRRHHAWVGVLAFDEFAFRAVVRRPPPYRTAAITIPADGLPWTDNDDVLTAAWLNREYNLFVGVEVVRQAALAVAGSSPFNPLRSYLDGLKWDGIKRVDTWLVAFLGADDTAYVRAVGRRWLISAVARAFAPGSKADHVLILEGIQGLLKSTALRALAPTRFTDELDAIGSKDAAGQLLGVWIVELAELDALSRSEISRVKAFMSKTFDRYRPSYGRHVVKFERQCVFAGTVNNGDYLRDETGNRRFWPVRCRGVGATARADIGALERDRDQLWAEAVALYRAGEKWWLETPDLARLAASEQEERLQVDSWEPLVEGFVAARDAVTVGDILGDLGVEIPRQGQVEQNRVARCLRHLGWARRQRYVNGRRRWMYVPPSPVGPPEPVTSPPSGDAEPPDPRRPSPSSPVSLLLPNREVERKEKHEFDIGEVYRPAGETGGSSDGGDAAEHRICYACKRDNFWTSRFGVRNCRLCHPPVAGAEL